MFMKEGPRTHSGRDFPAARVAVGDGQDSMEPIKILGGGIAGMMAAVTLKRAGIEVHLHESKGYCGKRTRDFQFLENWSSREDVLDTLRAMGLETGFYVKPWYSQQILSPALRKYVGHSKRPLMYLVKRGEREDSLDKALERQVKREGVVITYHSRLKRRAAKIIATGFRAPTFMVNGIIFGLDHPDKSIVLLDNELSPRSYSYLIVNDKIGEIACAHPAGCSGAQERMKATVQRFEEILRTRIGRVQERFASPVSFDLLTRAKVHGQYFVGEAAGFQDHLAGFGMLYAFKSGYYAARSIIEGVDYDRLWKKDFLRPLRISRKNRAIYDRLTNQDYERFVAILRSRNPVLGYLRGGDDFRSIMKRLYNTPLSLFHAYFRGRILLRSFRIS